MSWPKTRRNPRLELLEQREVLSTMAAGAGPSLDVQYMLELINEARTDPPAAAQRMQANLSSATENALDYFGEDLDQALNEIRRANPRPPVAWNPTLTSAAQGHSEDLAARQTQSHLGPRGETLGNRLDSVGYTQRGPSSENVFSFADPNEAVDHAMQAFLIDWGQSNAGNGHRKNIIQTDSRQPSFNEVGIGIAEMVTEKKNPFLGADDPARTETTAVVTQVFGQRTDRPAQVVGVVYDDANGDGFYSVGEGQGGVVIEIANLETGSKQRVVTWESGGYQQALSPGRYRLTAFLDGKELDRREIRISSENKKVDFELSQLAAAATSTAQNQKPVSRPSTGEVFTSVPVKTTPTTATLSTPTTTTPADSKATPSTVVLTPLKTSQPSTASTSTTESAPKVQTAAAQVPSRSGSNPSQSNTNPSQAANEANPTSEVYLRLRRFAAQPQSDPFTDWLPSTRFSTAKVWKSVSA